MAALASSLPFLSAPQARPQSPSPSQTQAHAGALPELEQRLRDKLWRGSSLAATLPGSIPSGFRALDEQLPGGGWPVRCLTELMLPAAGIGEIRFLAQTLATLTRAGRQIILLAPPHTVFPEGWAQLGIDVSRILLIQSDRPADRLWAVEQSIKSAAFGALLAWIPEIKPEALRRLQLAAAAADGLCFLLRPSAAQHTPSPAPLRLALGRGRAAGAPPDHNADPATGQRMLSVQLLKRRGPVLAKALQIALPEVRPLRLVRTAGTPAQVADKTASLSTSSHSLSLTQSRTQSVTPSLTPSQRHALGRAPLPHAAARPHPAPAA